MFTNITDVENSFVDNRWYSHNIPFNLNDGFGC